MSKIKAPLCDVKFRKKFHVFYVMRQRGVYDVFRGLQPELVGRVTHSYGQWCFVADSGDDRFHYGDTRNDAVWDWLKWYEKSGGDCYG